MSLRSAINAKCAQCAGRRSLHLGSWRDLVGACRNDRCSLWSVRPMPRRSSEAWIDRYKKHGAAR